MIDKWETDKQRYNSLTASYGWGTILYALYIQVNLLSIAMLEEDIVIHSSLIRILGSEQLIN